MRVDIELALVSAPSMDLKGIQDALPDGFFVATRFCSGAGIRICMGMC